MWSKYFGLEMFEIGFLQRLTEADVYQAVARLFHNELDLMDDFKSFLPDAIPMVDQHQNDQSQRESAVVEQTQQRAQGPKAVAGAHQGKRQLVGKEHPNAKVT